jgi:hypothetical protein
MSNDSFKVKNSLNIKPTSETTTSAGDIRVASEDSNRLKYNDGSNENYVIASSSLLGNNVAVKTDANGQLVDSTVTATQLEYLSTTTSDVQTQLDGKQATGNYITGLTGDVVAAGPGSVASTIQPGVVDNGKLASSAVDDSKVSATAAISRSKIADGTVGQVVINDPTTGALSSEAQLAKSRGGTGADNSSVTFPSSGVVVTEDAVETLTNKTISGASNTISNIPRSAIDAGNANEVLIDDGSGNVTSEAHLAKSRGGTGIDNSSVTFPSTGVIVTEDASENITNKTIGSSTSGTLGNSLQFTELAAKPSSNPATNVLAFYPKSDGNFYSLNSSGVEKPVGSGTGGSKNYLTAYKGNPGNGDFETGATTGFSLGSITVTGKNMPVTPTFGSGASPNLSIGIESAAPISGNYSLNLQISTATGTGNMLATDAFAIDSSDQAKILNYFVNYSIISGAGNATYDGTILNNIAIAAWDVTNSAWLPVSNPFGFIQTSGVGSCSGYFQTAYNTASVRLVLYGFGSSSATLTKILFDDFFVGPAPVNQVIGPVSSKLNTLSSTTVTANTALTFTTTEYDLTGSLSSFNKYTCPVSGLYQISAYINQTTSAGAIIYVAKNGTFTSSTANKIGGTHSAADASGSVSIQCNAGDTLQIAADASVTLSGTAANVSFTLIQSAGTGPAGRVVSMVAIKNGGTSTAGSAVASWTTVSKDSVAGFNASTGVYTVQIAGDYFLVFNAATTSTGNNTLRVFVNGTQVKSNDSNAANGIHSVSGLLTNLNPGDLVTVQTSSNATFNSNNVDTNLQIFMLQGPSSQQATPTVAASFYASANTTASHPVIFNTVLFDKTNSYNTSTGLYTCPSSGTYRISGALGTTSTFGVLVYKNGSAYVIAANPPQANQITAFSILIPCNAFDTLSVGNPSSATWLGGTLGSTDASYVNIERVGN